MGLVLAFMWHWEFGKSFAFLWCSVSLDYLFTLIWGVWFLAISGASFLKTAQCYSWQAAWSRLPLPNSPLERVSKYLLNGGLNLLGLSPAKLHPLLQRLEGQGIGKPMRGLVGGRNLCQKKKKKNFLFPPPWNITWNAWASTWFAWQVNQSYLITHPSGHRLQGGRRIVQ